MKTPSEIKADAAVCLTKPPHAMCDRFDLNKKCKGDCGYVIKSLYELVLHYESRLAQAVQERDAAICDIPTACGYCKYFIPKTYKCTNKLPCACISGTNTRWEWRGVCEENTKEDGHD